MSPCPQWIDGDDGGRCKRCDGVWNRGLILVGKRDVSPRRAASTPGVNTALRLNPSGAQIHSRVVHPHAQCNWSSDQSLAGGAASRCLLSCGHSVHGQFYRTHARHARALFNSTIKTACQPSAAPTAAAPPPKFSFIKTRVWTSVF